MTESENGKEGQPGKRKGEGSPTKTKITTSRTEVKEIDMEETTATIETMIGMTGEDSGSSFLPIEIDSTPGRTLITTSPLAILTNRS